MSEEQKPARQPLRCPCCRASLAEDTPHAMDHQAAVRVWFHKALAMILIACAFVGAAIVLDRFWGIDKPHDLLFGVGIGLMVAGLLDLSNHYKARLA